MQDWFDQAVQPPGTSGAVPIAGTPNSWDLAVTGEQWSEATESIAAGGGRLISLWASRDTDGAHLVRAAFAGDAGVLVLTQRLTGSQSHYPGLEQWFPSASRMQRAITDLSGLYSTDADQRPWLRHAAWPAAFHPLTDAAIPDRPPAPSMATRSCRLKATASTRFRSGRCMLASSSRATSAFPSWAKKFSGSS